MWSRICSEIFEQWFSRFYVNLEIISSLDSTKHKKQYKRCGLKAMFNKKNYLTTSMIVIQDSVIACLRRFSGVWEAYFSKYRSIKLGVGVGRKENVLGYTSDIFVTKPVRPTFIHYDTNNVDNSNLTEISVVILDACASIFKRYPDNQVTFSGPLPRVIRWSTQWVKLKKISALF